MHRGEGLDNFGNFSIRWSSESGARNVAVADIRLREGHQPAVEGGDKPAKESVGGRKGDRSGLGHLGFSGCREAGGRPVVSRLI